MRDHLLSWQLEHYAGNHLDRRNLVLHVLTVPLFLAGTVLLVAGALVAGWLALAGLAGMLVAVALQGRGHKHERSAPVPFSGPGDAVTRLFVEQWITFPRFVMSGGFARAWRSADAG